MPEKEPQFENSPENSMDNEEFFNIYDLLRECKLSDKKISQFIKKYNEGGRDMIKTRDKLLQEKQDFFNEAEREKRGLESRVKEMTDEELIMYQKEYDDKEQEEANKFLKKMANILL